MTMPRAYRTHAVRVLAVAGMAVSAAALAQQPQTPPGAAFRASVDLVTVDVSVLDRDRRPIRGLTAEDFSVFEGDVAQRIASFKAVDLPDRQAFQAPWMGDVAPDVVTNRFEAERLIVLLLDDYNVSVNPVHAKSARAIAHGIVNGLGPSDMAAVLYTFWHKNGQEFTSDRERLHAAIDRFKGMGRVPPPPAACADNQCVTGPMRAVAEIMGRWPERRKLLAYISPEGTYNFGPKNIEQGQAEANATAFSSVPDLERTFGALRTANVSVYQYDPRGLADSLSVLNGGIGMFADNTGGHTVTRTNDPESRVGELFAENSSYYLLGIEPASRPSAGEFRAIRVRVNRPGALVRTRSGYIGEGSAAPAGPSGNSRPAPDLERTMDGAAPTGDLPLTLSVAPFGRPGQRTATVAIVAGLERDGDHATTDVVRLVARAFDQNTATRTSRGAANATLELTPPASGRQTHFDVPAVLELAPGRYEIRVALESTRTATRGSAFMSVTVPDFTREPFAMSGLVLARVPAARPEGRHVLTNILPFTPTTKRAFSPSDRVQAMFRVYQGGRRQPVGVTLSARLVDRADRRVYERSLVLPPERFATPGRTAESGLTLPLTDLAQGPHLLTIEANDGVTAVVRHVQFIVE